MGVDGSDEAPGRGSPDPGAAVAAVATWELDLVTGQASWSPGCRDFYGGDPPAAASIDTLLAKVHEGDRAAVRDQVQRALDPSGPGALAVELRLPRPDGSCVWVAVWARAVFAEVAGQRRAVQLVGALEDRTARRERELRLQEDAERFRVLAANISQLAWMADPAGESYWHSRSWFEYSGATSEEMRGWGWTSLLAPDDAPRVVAQLRCCLEAGTDWEDTYRLRARDGSYRWFLGRARPVRDEDGRITRWLGTNTDVTEAREAHEALVVSERLLSSMMDNATGIAWVKDLAGRFLAVNTYTERVLELPRAEIIGRTVFDLFPADLAAEYAANDRQVLDGGQTVTVEESARLADGPHTFVSVKFPLRDAQGVVSGVGAICTDITALKESERERERLLEALREADQRKNHFLAVLSHEIRNPLASISNSVYLLEHAPPESAVARHAREVIARQNHHLTRLVDDLLDITRISLGRLTLRRTSLELNALLAEVVADYRESFAQAGIGLELRGTSEPLCVHGDHTRLGQIFGNLLSNANRCVPAGGRTVVSVAVDASRGVAVSVSDDGPGLSRETLAHLFQPFSQSESTMAAGHRGLGLGLSLVKTLAELHGGTVSAASPGPGRGATFVVRLPLEAVGPVARSVAATATATRTPRRVLLIEDDADAAETLHDVLAAYGHAVVTARSGATGIEEARAFGPDVVLCDLGLPDMDGYAVARTMRADPGLESIYLVALSGYSRPEDVARSLEAGFARHVAKPPDLEALAALLAAVPARGARG